MSAAPVVLPTASTVRPRTQARARRRNGLPEQWPITAMYAGYPIFWALGLSNIAVPVIGMVILHRLVRRPDVHVPRGFGLWFLFVAWMLLTVSQLEKFSHYVAFTWRLLLWVGALAVIVYIADTTRRRLPDRTVLNSLLVLWGSTVVGGYLGLLLPSVRLWTPAQLIIPRGFRSIDFIQVMVAPRFAQVQDFLGYPLPRPAAPFTYTNSWGANMALLTPVLFAAWPALGRRGRFLAGFLAVASLVPMILSVNRGLWITLIGLSMYVAARTAQRRDQAARRLAGLGLVLIALIAFTPMGAVVEGRLDNDHSNNARATVASQAREEVLKSPILGYGSPRQNPLNPTLPPIGTHGGIWYVLFCHGFPGAIFFMGGLISLLMRTARPANRRYLWLHGVVLGVIIMLPFYELQPMPIFVMAACAGVALRDCAPPRRDDVVPA